MSVPVFQDILATMSCFKFMPPNSSKHHRSPRISEETWEMHKKDIIREFHDGAIHGAIRAHEWTLDQSLPDFKPTLPQLRYRISKWKKEDEAQSSGNHLALALYAGSDLRHKRRLVNEGRSIGDRLALQLEDGSDLQCQRRLVSEGRSIGDHLSLGLDAGSDLRNQVNGIRSTRDHEGRSIRDHLTLEVDAGTDYQPKWQNENEAQSSGNPLAAGPVAGSDLQHLLDVTLHTLSDGLSVVPHPVLRELYPGLLDNDRMAGLIWTSPLEFVNEVHNAIVLLYSFAILPETFILIVAVSRIMNIMSALGIACFESGTFHPSMLKSQVPRWERFFSPQLKVFRSAPLAQPTDATQSSFSNSCLSAEFTTLAYVRSWMPTVTPSWSLPPPRLSYALTVKTRVLARLAKQGGRMHVVYVRSLSNAAR
ncbi:hypothetical protein EJ06DRAFT_189070 [Trichodelitschia bisporula]|uniref:Clr5 domain-containing protein n=1 Tax=Trichodelitschia bisporula TaxID=703511 RepID=A0A6G1I7N7_9PEZI|nr:hypothetical protein EJ06DRAFT_189070 [Trichodelitschia bisporula]